MTATVAQVDEDVDRLASALTLFDPADALFRALAGWREECETPPLPEMVDTDTALAVIARSVWVRRVVRCAVAAAIAAVFIVLGVLLVPSTTWWWLVPAAGLLLFAPYVAVATMRDETPWNADQVRTEQNGAPGCHRS